MEASSGRPEGPPPISDQVMNVQTKFIIPCDVYEGHTNLLPDSVKAHVSFEVSEHISHLSIGFAEVVRTLPTTQDRVHKLAKISIAAEGTQITIEQTTAEALVMAQVWTAEKASNTKLGRRSLWEVRLTFLRDNASYEGVLVDNPGSLTTLSDALIAGGNEKQLYLIARTGDKLITDVKSLLAQFAIDSTISPLKKWYPRTRRFQVQIGQTIEVEDRPNYTLGPSYSFFPHGAGQVDDYLTRMAFGVIQEQEYKQKALGGSNWKEGTAVLVKSVGDTLEVCFGLDPLQADVRKIWRAKVQEPLPYAPYGYTTATINRPWDKTDGAYQDIDTHNALTLEQLGDAASTVHAIKSHEGVRVSWNYVMSDKVFKRSVSAIERLFKIHQRYSKGEQSYSPTEAQENDMKVFLNNTPVLLPRVDLYYAIEGTPEDGMELQAEQEDAIRACRAAPGGWVLIQGPPGTGKTYIAIQICRPFLASEKHIPVLCTSPTNAGVDDMAKKGDAMLKSLGSGKYVIRLHSVTTERSATVSVAKKERGVPENAKPRIFQDPSQEEINLVETVESVRVMYNRWVKQSRQRHEGVDDVRFIEMQLSLSYRVLQVLGYAPGGEHLLPDRFTTDENGMRIDTYADVVDAYAHYEAGEEFDEDSMAKFRELLKGVQTALIANAALVVTTLASAATAWIYGTVTPEIIIVDEAARALEVDLLPLSAHYPSARGKVLVGDINQLRPVSHSATISKEYPCHNFAAQQTLSLMHRLQKSGFPVTMLKTQFRAIPEIAEIYNQVVYHGELRNDPSTTTRRLPRLLSEFNKRFFNRRSPVIFIDLPRANARDNDTNSQFNTANCAYALNLIDELFAEPWMTNGEKPTVAVMMCYQAQYLLYSAAKDNMETMKIDWADQLTVDKIDRRQGQEWDIVIVDLTVTERPGFLREMNRLNVLWSRARSGLYIIGSKKKMDSIRDRSSTWLREFYGECLRFRVTVDETPTISRFVDFDNVKALISGIEDGVNEAADNGMDWGEIADDNWNTNQQEDTHVNQAVLNWDTANVNQAPPSYTDTGVTRGVESDVDTAFDVEDVFEEPGQNEDDQYEHAEDNLEGLRW